ncbi:MULTISPECIES: hypothetical protein [Enterobacteriaceae]|uniref:hypothetical protein n=1 Tax=Enterobacteriaceae TaxID=543 RepID=UPI000A471891|nr:hypothetical protein [Klebsiella variicola]
MNRETDRLSDVVTEMSAKALEDIEQQSHDLEERLDSLEQRLQTLQKNTDYFVLAQT